MKKLIMTIMFGAALCMLSITVKADTVDYSKMSTEELADTIEDNHALIAKKSKKLADRNRACIEMIKERDGEHSEEFIARISRYADDVEMITEKIRKKQKNCVIRNRKLKKAIARGRSNNVIRNNQIKLINNQNSLLSVLKSATDKTKGIVKYMKKTKKQVKSENIRLMQPKDDKALEQLETSLDKIAS